MTAILGLAFLLVVLIACAIREYGALTRELGRASLFVHDRDDVQRGRVCGVCRAVAPLVWVRLHDGDTYACFDCAPVLRPTAGHAP